MKKYIKSFLLLVTITLTHTVYAGAYTPGYINVTMDPYNPAVRTLEATMNFKHNPASGSLAYLKVTKGPNLHVAASDGGSGNFACFFDESTNPQLYADAKLILDNLPASSKLTITGIYNEECSHVGLSTSSVYGEEKIIHTVPQ